MSQETDSPKNQHPDKNNTTTTTSTTTTTKTTTPHKSTTPDNNNNNNNNDGFAIQDDWTLISQGAEAKLWRIPRYLPFEGGGGDCLAKQRFSKSYRHPTLDERLTKARCKSEVKCLVKCRRGGVPCPAIYGVVPPVIYMEFIQGQTVRSYLDQQQQQQHGGGGSEGDPTPQDTTQDSHNNTNLSQLAKVMGDLIGRVHNVGVIHGDLTTSNMMLQPQSHDNHTSTDVDNQKLIMIDFGLARVSNNPEELAVDLYVLERALISTHPEVSSKFIEQLLAAYKATSTKSHQVLHRLGQVRLRGRKRECFG